MSAFHPKLKVFLAKKIKELFKYLHKNLEVKTMFSSKLKHTCS